MKILIYTHEFAPFLGGLATTSLRIATGLSQRGYEVIVLAPNYSESESIDNNFDFKIERMSFLTRNHGIPTPIKEFAGYFNIKNEVEKINPDVLIALTREAHAACGLLNKFPRKVIARVAGYEAFRFLSGKKLINRLIAKPMYRFYSNTSKIVTASKATMLLFEKAGIPKNKLEVVYNGVGPKFLDSKLNLENLHKIKNKLGISENQKILLTVSRLVPGKGQDNTIRSVANIIPTFKDLRLLIIGEGSYRSELEKLVAKYSLSDYVFFLGSKTNDELIDYYDLCDIFLLPNRTEAKRENVEGLPNVLYEAASRGKPIIAGTPGGGKEIIKEDYNGFVVDGEDVEAITNGILKLIDDREKTALFGKRSKELIEDNFTYEKMIDGYEKIILS